MSAVRLPREYEDLAPLVEFAPMRKRHLDEVLGIERQVYPRPWTTLLFESELSLRSHRHYVVAKLDGLVVGYAGMMFALDEAHVTTIAVDPTWQRRKIGTQLMLHAVHTARSRGSTGMTLEVRVSNEPAQAMYMKFGFMPSGIRKNYYSETHEDALIMWVNDIQAGEYGRRLETIGADFPTVPGDRHWRL